MKTPAAKKSPNTAIKQADKTVVKAAQPVATKKLAKKSTPSAENKQGSTGSTKPAVPKKKIATPSKVEDKKIKLIRDSFMLPQADHDLIKQCKKVAVSAGRETKKSEVLRAAMQAFHALPVQTQLAAYASLPSIAVGRPKSK